MTKMDLGPVLVEIPLQGRWTCPQGQLREVRAGMEETQQALGAQRRCLTQLGGDVREGFPEEETLS